MKLEPETPPLPAAGVTFAALYRQRAEGMGAAVTARLVELVFSPAAQVADWAARIGLKVEPQADGVVILENPGLGRTAIYDGLDPVTRAVCLGFAVAGPFWPQVLPDLLETVNKEWRWYRRKKKYTEE